MIEKKKEEVRKPGLILLIIFTILGLGVMFFIPPISENARYHDFADQRRFSGMPNFFNVLSNILFLITGIFGLKAWRRAQWERISDQWPWLMAAGGAILISLGSSYYHLHPENQTLYWDRLPMVMVFMALFSAVLTECIHPRFVNLLIPLVLFGVLSLEVWRRSELAGAGDLRFYGFVQYYPMLAIPLILWSFPSRYDRGYDYWIVLGLYGIAKGAEILDHEIFRFSANILSGHSVKHVMAAAALWVAFRMATRRKPLSSKRLCSDP